MPQETAAAAVTGKPAAASRFVYQLTVRPAGADTTPAGVGRECHDTDVLLPGRGHGSVSYDAPLTVEEIAHYALVPATEMRALNGQCFTQAFGGKVVHHRVRLAENCLALQIDSDCEGVKRSEVLNYPDFIKRSARWAEAQ